MVSVLNPFANYLHDAYALLNLALNQHPFTRDVAASQDVFEKRNHVVATFGTAKADDENRVVRVAHELVLT